MAPSLLSSLAPPPLGCHPLPLRAAPASGKTARRPLGGAARPRAGVDAAGEGDTAEVDRPKKTTGPSPRKFVVADGQLGAVVASSLPLAMRLGSGALVAGWSASVVKDEGQQGYTFAKFGGNRLKETSKIPTFKRPEKPLEIYEFEACPFCKKVREAISILDLDVLVYPCPKDGTTWRPKAIKEGGKKMFPYIVDPNTGTSMYESDDIIQYLFKTYGDGEVPVFLRLGALTSLTAGLSQLPRGSKGSSARPSKIPEKPLILWGYEGSPFVKIVREELCELEIPYLLKTCARGSQTRDEMLQRFDHFQVPCLEDPNNGESMYESAYIVEYLNKTYAA